MLVFHLWTGFACLAVLAVAYLLGLRKDRETREEMFG